MNNEELREYWVSGPGTLNLSANHPGRRMPGPPIIAGPDPVADIEVLVSEIYDYIYTKRLPQRKNMW
jgi:hypothetical protein